MLDKQILWRAFMVPMLALSILCTAGCNGCSDNSKTVAEKKKELEEKKKKERKPDFESRTPVILPAIFPPAQKKIVADENLTPLELKKFERKEQKRLEKIQRDARRRNRAKPGHWMTTNFQVISNNFPTAGDLISRSVKSSRGIPIEGTDYYIETKRPVSVPKGEWKSLETSVYLARREDANQANIDFQLRNASTGLTFLGMTQPTNLMRPHQYHVVLLSNRADTYTYMDQLNSVELPMAMSNNNEMRRNYFVIPTRVDDPSPLPQHALNWTTIAYIVWDNYSPDQLNPDQQNALLDWLHHGGQLIVSGPDCLDKIQNSFLSDFLPATFESTANLTNKDFEQLNENWTIADKSTNLVQSLSVNKTAPMLGVKFAPHEEAKYVDNTGELAIERRVGRGRVVVTAFSLADKLVRKWTSFNSFFNGALLRKPRRKFGETAYIQADTSFKWVDDQSSVYDPLVGSRLRYLCRDLGPDGTLPTHNLVSPPTIEDKYGRGIGFDRGDIESQSRLAGQGDLIRTDDNIWQYGGYQDDKNSGVAGWNDQSAISNAARGTLKQAAGISPPSSDFILKMLAAYLFVLVPLNWLIFRMIGKVEWAWIAVPIIAIAGAFTVVKLASLDIGFARSNTQVSLVELFEGYERGHVAEYSALYTSLSTRYDVELDNRSAQSLPFRKVLEDVVRKETIDRVTLNRSRENQIEGFQVKSNTTSMLHTEYTLDFGGRVELEKSGSGQLAISNMTRLEIKDAGVLYRSGIDEYKVSTLQTLTSGQQSAPLNFEVVAKDQIGEQWLRNPLFNSSERDAREVWNKNVEYSVVKKVTLATISEFPELKDRWSEFARLARRQYKKVTNAEDLYFQEATFEQFSKIYQRLGTREGIDLGRMFDAVTEKLELEIGEMRLIGHSSKRIGGTQFEPGSTQTDRQTLIVVHLKKGDLPTAMPDVNKISDVASWVDDFDDDDEEDEGEDFSDELDDEMEDE